jgi:hypothetical protein
MLLSDVLGQAASPAAKFSNVEGGVVFLGSGRQGEGMEVEGADLLHHQEAILPTVVLETIRELDPDHISRQKSGHGRHLSHRHHVAQEDVGEPHQTHILIHLCVVKEAERDQQNHTDDVNIIEPLEEIRLDQVRQPHRSHRDDNEKTRLVHPFEGVDDRDRHGQHCNEFVPIQHALERHPQKISQSIVTETEQDRDHHQIVRHHSCAFVITQRLRNGHHAGDDDHEQLNDRSSTKNWDPILQEGDWASDGSDDQITNGC